MDGGKGRKESFAAGSMYGSKAIEGRRQSNRSMKCAGLASLSRNVIVVCRLVACSNPQAPRPPTTPLGDVMAARGWWGAAGATQRKQWKGGETCVRDCLNSTPNHVLLGPSIDRSRSIGRSVDRGPEPPIGWLGGSWLRSPLSPLAAPFAYPLTTDHDEAMFIACSSRGAPVRGAPQHRPTIHHIDRSSCRKPTRLTHTHTLSLSIHPSGGVESQP
jgi:hypothetical protein